MSLRSGISLSISSSLCPRIRALSLALCPAYCLCVPSSPPLTLKNSNLLFESHDLVVGLVGLFCLYSRSLLPCLWSTLHLLFESHDLVVGDVALLLCFKDPLPLPPVKH